MSTPQGYSGAAALAQVQAYANEPTFPSAGTTLNFLNRGVEEVCRRVGGPRLWAPYYTIANQTVVALNDDVQDIVSANFSIGATNSSGQIPTSSPFAQGSLVYPMMALEQAGFMDAAAGFPAVGFGPPQAYFTYQDTGSAPTNTLPVPPQTILAQTSGTSALGTYYVVITYTNPSGETTASPVASYTITDTIYQVLVNTPPSYFNTTGYNVYASFDAPSGPFSVQNSTPVLMGNSYTVPYPLTSLSNNPPTVNTATGAGTGGSLYMQLYPAAMIGQVNIYYRARPMLWADTTAASWTNLDTSAQEAVILFAVRRVLVNRGRSAEAKQIWEPEYEQMIGDLKESMNRRTTPKSGRVRDVANRSFPSSPWWLTGL